MISFTHNTHFPPFFSISVFSTLSSLCQKQTFHDRFTIENGSKSFTDLNCSIHQRWNFSTDIWRFLRGTFVCIPIPSNECHWQTIDKKFMNIASILFAIFILPTFKSPWIETIANSIFNIHLFIVGWFLLLFNWVRLLKLCEAYATKAHIHTFRI